MSNAAPPQSQFKSQSSTLVTRSPPAELPFSPAAERNQRPILDVLLRVLPSAGHALEIASGTGQHVAHFAGAMPGWSWQPTDFDADALPAIAAYASTVPARNVMPPLQLDVLQAPWLLPHDARYDAIYCANMLHISPWATCAALMRGSARHLAPGGRLITYGPYLESDVPTAPGNLSFDASLRARHPHWGLRDLQDVVREAAAARLALQQRHALPANNLLLIWQRAGKN